MKLIFRTITLPILIIVGFFCFVGSSNAGTWTSSGNDTYYNSGNVFIGDTGLTNIPKAPLNIVTSTSTKLNFVNRVGGAGIQHNIDYYSGDGTNNKLPQLRIQVKDNNYSGDFNIFQKISGAESNNIVPRFHINGLNGYVGILTGTSTVTHALDVAGDINFTGNLYKNGVLFTSSSTSASTTVNSSPWLNELGTVEVRGTIGTDAVDLIVHIPFFLYFLIFSVILLSFRIIIKPKFSCD
jgi:hypothetical protein